MTLNLRDGALVINNLANDTTPNFSSSKLNLYGGILSLENGIIDTLQLKNFSSASTAKLNFDIDLDAGTSDSIDVSSAITSSNLTINSINLLTEGEEGTKSITVFTDSNAPVLSNYTTYSGFTNTFSHVFSQTSLGVLDVETTALSGTTGLRAAVLDSEHLTRTFSLTSDETETLNIGDMAGSSGALLTIYGNGYTINGNGKVGINNFSGQTINLRDVVHWDKFSETTNNGGAFNIAGVLTAYNTGFDKNRATTYNGGAIYVANSGEIILEGTDFTSNSANNGGAIYNTGTLSILSNSTGTNFSNNTATTNGGAIYNTGTLLLNTDLGNLTFSGNTASVANDIYNDSTGVINITGFNNTLSLAGGIAGFGTINKLSTSTLTITGDVSNFTGTFNQTTGTTNISGNYFNSETNINGGVLNLAGGMSANSIINLDETATLNLSSNSDIAFDSSSLTGSGNVNKTGTGNITFNGDFSGFTGTYTQNSDVSTILTGNSFNSMYNINSGELEISTDGNLSSAATLNMSSGSKINLTGTSALTLSGSQLVGIGTINKSGTGTTTITGDFSNFSGDYNQSAGTTSIDLDSISMTNTKNITGGTLNTTGLNPSSNIILGDSATWNHNTSDNDYTITLSPSTFTFNGTGSTATFGRNGESGTANYILSENIQNATDSNTIAFTNSKVKLGATDYTGNTDYVLNNSTLDLSSGDSTSNSYYFTDLSLTNSSIGFDLVVNTGGLSFSTDTLTVENATTDQFNLNVSDIVILNSSAIDFDSYTLNSVLTGISFANNTGEITTAAGTYTLTTTAGGTSVKLEKQGTTLTLNNVNTSTDSPRSYQIATTETLADNLSSMAAGNFSVIGESTTASSHILSGNNLYSMFSIGDDNTAFTLKNLTAQNAKKTGDGSVISLTNANSTVNVNNVIFGNNNVTEGNGGVISQTSGILNIINSTFSENTSTIGSGTSGNGGAVYGTNFSIERTLFTNNTATNGGAIYNNGTGTIYGNSTFTGNNSTTNGGAIYNNGTLTLNSTSGNITFSENKVNTLANDIYNSGTGTLNINGSSNTVSVGSISGSGAINKSGNGILSLTGDQTFNGTFTQTAGTTNVASEFFAGSNIVNGGNINWNTNSASSYNFDVNGGIFTVANGGVLNFSDSSDFALAATIRLQSGGTCK